MTSPDPAAVVSLLRGIAAVERGAARPWRAIQLEEAADLIDQQATESERLREQVRRLMNGDGDGR